MSIRLRRRRHFSFNKLQRHEEAAAPRPTQMRALKQFCLAHLSRPAAVVATQVTRGIWSSRFLRIGPDDVVRGIHCKSPARLRRVTTADAMPATKVDDVARCWGGRLSLAPVASAVRRAGRWRQLLNVDVQIRPTQARLTPRVFRRVGYDRSEQAGLHLVGGLANLAGDQVAHDSPRVWVSNTERRTPEGLGCIACANEESAAAKKSRTPAAA